MTSKTISYLWYPKGKSDMEIAVCTLYPEKLKIQERGSNLNEMENLENMFSNV